jgi:hypothetical protein
VFTLKIMIFLGLSLASSLAQDELPSPAILEWQDVAPGYKSFDEIKPVLVNGGQKSIFLSRIWPHGSAQLERLSEETGVWESGEWSGGCGTVSKATVPIEIKPRTERAIDVYSQLSMDDWDKPTHFVAATRAERPVEGRYRFVLRYSMEPWTLVHHPSVIYKIVSPEFVVDAP